jgi:hypothetical protein
MEENKIAQLEKTVQMLQARLIELERGIYNFSGKQEWKKTLVVPKLELSSNTATNSVLEGDGVGGFLFSTPVNFTGGIKSNGTSGTNATFSTTGTFTVTVSNGIITSVV